MDKLKAKFYEFLIKRKIHKRKFVNIKFEYSLLVARGFTEYYVEPNTTNRVTIYYDDDYYWNKKTYHKTYKNIKLAYKDWR